MEGLTACLLAADPIEIAKRRPGLLFYPSLEVPVPTGDGGSIFLSETPREALQHGKVPKVPCLIGFNSHESLQASRRKPLLDYQRKTVLENVSMDEGPMALEALIVHFLAV
jgi:hypothetical protein